jgi:hypothetical protein
LGGPLGAEVDIDSLTKVDGSPAGILRIVSPIEGKPHLTYWNLKAECGAKALIALEMGAEVSGELLLDRKAKGLILDINELPEDFAKFYYLLCD